MILDLEALEKAIGKLEKSIEYSKSESAKKDPEIFEQFRNSVIQCYEFTYELCWKMLKRRVEADAADAALIDRMSYKDLIRTGAERGFIANPIVWFTYREDRNLTSHTYDEIIAERVYVRALAFLTDAKKLLEKLKAGNF